MLDYDEINLKMVEYNFLIKLMNLSLIIGFLKYPIESQGKKNQSLLLSSNMKVQDVNNLLLRL